MQTEGSENRLLVSSLTPALAAALIAVVVYFLISGGAVDIVTLVVYALGTAVFAFAITYGIKLYSRNRKRTA